MEVTERTVDGCASVSLVAQGDEPGTVVISLVATRYVTAGRGLDGDVNAGLHLDDDRARELLAALAAFYATRDEHDEPRICSEDGCEYPADHFGACSTRQ